VDGTRYSPSSGKDFDYANSTIGPWKDRYNFAEPPVV